MEGGGEEDILQQVDTEKTIKKRKIHPYHRIKPHTNPLADKDLDVPLSPKNMDWSKFYPTKQYARVDFADIGCGYGGLTVSLGESFPQNITLGIEIRDKVVEYVNDRINTLREKNPGVYQNISVMKTNAMKYIPNYFEKGQLKKMFFLFPDPHFKKSKQKRRIISTQLLDEYAFVVQEGGLVYTITDVEDLHNWMVHHFTEHPLFQRLSNEEFKDDPTVPLVINSSEESRKVDRIRGKKFLAIFRRIITK